MVTEIFNGIRPLVAFPGQGYRRPNLTSRPLRFKLVREYVIAYAPEKKPLWISGRVPRTAKSSRDGGHSQRPRVSPRVFTKSPLCNVAKRLGFVTILKQSRLKPESYTTQSRFGSFHPQTFYCAARGAQVSEKGLPFCPFPMPIRKSASFRFAAEAGTLRKSGTVLNSAPRGNLLFATVRAFRRGLKHGATN